VAPLSATVAPPRKNRALDEAIHAIPLEWFTPLPAVYWVDLLASAATGWWSFALAARYAGWPRAGLLLAAAVALYRAVLFIHELTHRAGRELPVFTIAWNALVGVPLMVPSFLYEGVHTDHHRQSCYGTGLDPEYVPFGHRPPALILGSVLASLCAPIALAFRFGILAPVSWGVPSVRHTVLERASALVMNPGYARRVPIGASGHAQEAAACAVFWIAAFLWWTGWLPFVVIRNWFIVSAAVSGVNAFRTLAAHRYDQDAGELSMTAQLLDTCTIAPTGLRAILGDAGRALIAPVGLRYHALHHWIPSLPYHNLGRAHRLLVSTLGADAPYHATVERGFLPPLRDLLRRSRARSRA
jgi:fatty acid desaturase